MISEKAVLFILLGLAFIMLVVVLKYLAIPKMKKQRPNNEDLPYTQRKLDFKGLKKISKRPLFGIGKLFMDENDYYYGNGFLFEYVNKEKYFKIPLSSITHVLKTNYNVNNQSVWLIIFDYNDEKREFKFLPTRALFNNTFIAFKKMMKTKHPTVQQSYFTLVEWEWKKS